MKNETTLHIPVIFEVTSIYQYDKLKDILNDAASFVANRAMYYNSPDKQYFQLNGEDAEIEAVDNFELTTDWEEQVDTKIEEFRGDDEAYCFNVKAQIPVIVKHSYDLSEEGYGCDYILKSGIERIIEETVINELAEQGAASVYYEEIDDEIIWYVER